MQLSSKKLKRIEKKKKKLAALIEISELNNKDRTELQCSSMYGPDGDKAEGMSNIQRSSLAEKDSPVVAAGEELSQSNGRGDAVASSDNQPEVIGEVKTHHHKKKKRKSKHHEDIENGEKRKSKYYDDTGLVEKRKSKPADKEREEWPSLVPNSSEEVFSVKKRKSSSDLEIQKERPIKVLKRQPEYYEHLETPHLSSSSSFTDDLASFKKDLNRIKHKKEKKEKKAKSLKNDENDCDFSKEDLDNVIPSDELDKKIDWAKSQEDLEGLKQLLKLRKKQLKEIPNVRLKGTGKDADLECLGQRVPVLPSDVQTLLLFSQLGSKSPRFPRWVELKKGNRISKTVVLVVEGVSAYDFLSRESSCPALHDMDVKAEMVSPYGYNSCLAEELCAVPLTKQQRKDLEKRFGKEICPEALMTDKVIKVLRSAFSISSVPKTEEEAVEQKIAVPPGDQFPRTELLLSAWQLIEEGYPLPYSCKDLGDRYPDYVMTKDTYSEVTPSSPLWALDCEMCLTRCGNELTRVSVVNEKHETVYESFCLPRNPIINYLTEFSGITPEMLRGVKTRLEDVQKALRELLPPDVILVGQSLNGDLHALKMMHPYIIDTSVIFNLTGVRRRKSKLSKLTEEFLKESIQQRGAAGHDSVEDSLAALKLVQFKLTKSLEFGDAVLTGLAETNRHIPGQSDVVEDINDLQVEVGPTMATSLFKHFSMQNKSVCLISSEETLAQYSTFVAAAHRDNKQRMRTVATDNNTDTISRMSEECCNSDFTLAHLTLGDDDNITLVNSWMEDLYNIPPFNAFFIIILGGSHSSYANGAVLLKVKKPNLRLRKPRKAE